VTSKLLSLGGKVGYQEVREYLKSRGWHEVPSKRSYAAIYRTSEHDAAEAVVPLERALADYDSAMVRVAQEVASVEGRGAEAVLRDLLQPRKDILRFALEGEGVGPGSVGLHEGHMLLGGARKALLASACSVKSPKRYHPRMSLGEADVFVRRCQLGPTEAGSFVLVVESPLDVGPQRTLTSDPFGRRAVEYLFRSVAALAECIRYDRVERLFDAKQDPSMPVLSANLCEAMADMLPPEGTADLRLQSTWSPLLPAPRNVPSAVTLDRTMYATIEDLARQLRPSEGPKRDRYIGLVAELAGVANPEGNIEGDVVLAVHVSEDEIIRVRVMLSAPDYQKAWQAHMQGRYVSVWGILHRGQRMHSLTEPSEFTVIGDESAVVLG
jgi:hypothetical protein